MTRPGELHGPDGGASDTTVPRALDGLASRVEPNGLPGHRLAEALAMVWVHTWEQHAPRHGGLPRSPGRR